MLCCLIRGYLLGPISPTKSKQLWSIIYQDHYPSLNTYIGTPIDLLFEDIEYLWLLVLI